MAKKIDKKLKEMYKAIDTAPVETLRKCLTYIACEAFEDDGEFNRDKDLGADFIGEVCNHLEAHGFVPTED